jgi:hypothetical protein
MRPLLALLILMLTICSSGISSAIAFTAERDDGCCVDGAGDGAPDPQSGDEGKRCPPLCHECACSPAFSVPTTVISIFRVVRFVEYRRTIHIASQLPASPFGEGVFHPPRHAA